MAWVNLNTPWADFSSNLRKDSRNEVDHAIGQVVLLEELIRFDTILNEIAHVQNDIAFGWIKDARPRRTQLLQAFIVEILPDC